MPETVCCSRCDALLPFSTFQYKLRKGDVRCQQEVHGVLDMPKWSPNGRDFALVLDQWPDPTLEVAMVLQGLGTEADSCSEPDESPLAPATPLWKDKPDEGEHGCLVVCFEGARVLLWCRCRPVWCRQACSHELPLLGVTLPWSAHRKCVCFVRKKQTQICVPTCMHLNHLWQVKLPTAPPMHCMHCLMADPDVLLGDAADGTMRYLTDQPGHVMDFQWQWCSDGENVVTLSRSRFSANVVVEVFTVHPGPQTHLLAPICEAGGWMANAGPDHLEMQLSARADYFTVVLDFTSEDLCFMTKVFATSGECLLDPEANMVDPEQDLCNMKTRPLWHPEQPIIAFFSMEKALCLLDVRTGVTRELEIPAMRSKMRAINEEQLAALCWSPDGSLLSMVHAVMGNPVNYVAVIKADGCGLVFTSAMTADHINHVTLSKASTDFLCAWARHMLAVYEVASGRCTTLHVMKPSWIQVVDFLFGGPILLVTVFEPDKSRSQEDSDASSPQHQFGMYARVSLTDVRSNVLLPALSEDCAAEYDGTGVPKWLRSVACSSLGDRLLLWLQGKNDLLPNIRLITS